MDDTLIVDQQIEAYVHIAGHFLCQGHIDQMDKGVTTDGNDLAMSGQGNSQGCVRKLQLQGQRQLPTGHEP
ncbi:MULTISPECIES: hypothetical protein [unclassified Pseudomonas]|uniref:hypothetical protein n=1 Tax=unclassified Pseudomonas TaxID=196821 RepID=UPI00211653F5|nr:MULTISPECIES: hypothetical protein [unclassified Pseudomonas]MCS4250343.1 hypothetical protein [Pseudomonas sp. BIGb0164]